MRKNRFSLLILLILSLTVAGAYATWNYTVANNVQELNHSITVNLANDEITTVDGGTLNAEGTITATIDDGGNYKAALVMGGEGFTVRYTPSSATPDVTAINMYATITVTSVQYNNEAVIAVSTETINTTSAVSEWNITPEMIGECLAIANITLPTPDDYADFEAAMAAGNTVITVTIGAQTN